MDEKIILLENEIDSEIFRFIVNDENKRNRNSIQIFINSKPLSHKEKKIICEYLDKFWLKELRYEGFITTSKKYHFSIKSYSETKYLVRLRLSLLSWIPKRFSL